MRLQVGDIIKPDIFEYGPSLVYLGKQGGTAYILSHNRLIACTDFDINLTTGLFRFGKITCKLETAMRYSMQARVDITITAAAIYTLETALSSSSTKVALNADQHIIPSEIDTHRQIYEQRLHAHREHLMHQLHLGIPHRNQDAYKL
jgi:hypothetical protein